MRVNRVMLLALVLLAGAFAVSAASRPASPDPAAARAARIARGGYLVRSIGCTDCHTPGTFWGAADTTRFLAGSEMRWAGPWGAVCARNLTPDPETGLGTWTEDQIATAIRTGNRPDGRQLAPIMPWLSFANLTDQDAHAIAAYLKSLPPVRHRVPDPVGPGEKVGGSVHVFPPPSAWDVPPSPGAAGR